MSQNAHGVWEELETTRTLGATIGTATVKMDTHTLAYILKGLGCRVEVYETMQTKGELPDDDQASFGYTKELRDNVKSTRDKTLESE